jgi:hypothetical protein
MEIFRDSIIQAEIHSAHSALKTIQNKENVPPPDSPVALRESHAGNRVPLKEISKLDDKKPKPFVMINVSTQPEQSHDYTFC